MADGTADDDAEEGTSKKRKASLLLKSWFQAELTS